MISRVGYRFKTYGTEERIVKTIECLWNYSPVFLDAEPFSEFDKIDVIIE